MPHRLLPFVCWLVIPLLVSCSRSGQNNAAETAIPADLAIVFGEGGGFTGAWTGFTIRADGQVLEWQGGAAEEQPRAIGQLQTEEVAALWQELRAREFFAQAEGEPGDLTRFVRVTAEGKNHEIRWVPGAGGVPMAAAPQESVPAQLYRRLLKSVEPLQSKRDTR